jgi:hypothetical protein
MFRVTARLRAPRRPPFTYRSSASNLISSYRSHPHFLIDPKFAINFCF